MRKTVEVRLVLIACASIFSGLGQEQRPAQEAAGLRAVSGATAGCLTRAKLNLSVNPQQVHMGQATTINWDVLMSDACGPFTIELDGKVVQDSGTKTIVPTQSGNVLLTLLQTVSGKPERRSQRRL